MFFLCVIFWIGFLIVLYSITKKEENNIPKNTYQGIIVLKYLLLVFAIIFSLLFAFNSLLYFVNYTQGSAHVDEFEQSLVTVLSEYPEAQKCQIDNTGTVEIYLRENTTYKRKELMKNATDTIAHNTHFVREHQKVTVIFYYNDEIVNVFN